MRHLALVALLLVTGCATDPGAADRQMALGLALMNQGRGPVMPLYQPMPVRTNCQRIGYQVICNSY